MMRFPGIADDLSKLLQQESTIYRYQTKLATESGESFIFADHFVAAMIAKVSEVTEKGLVLDNSTMQDVSTLTTQAENKHPQEFQTRMMNIANSYIIMPVLLLDVSGWGDKQNCKISSILSN